ncbi:MAG: TIGR03016 family PEP-CTERM system-associated outer membrane protein [Gammaproteobacteria bacterium]|nr:TIGR03016 family PEP-CTERM system-associated outer membrane protein [Gammaproteobacteria bacterium]
MTLSQSYTDNLFLDAKNAQGAFYTSLVPGLSVRGNGPRLQLNLDYASDSQIYIDHSDINTTTANLQSDLSLELLRNHLFLDAYGSMFPSLVSGAGRISGNSRTVKEDRQNQFSQNRSDVVSYGVKPRYQQTFGTVARLLAGVDVGNTTTGETSLADAGATFGNQVGAGANYDWHASLESGPNLERASWGLVFVRRETVARDAGDDSTLQSVFTEWGYQVNRQLQVIGRVGVEDNDYSGDRQQRHGAAWEVGGVFTPSPRTSLSARVGQLSFGTTKSFNFSHQARRFTLTGSYREQLNTSGQLLRSRRLFSRVDGFGKPVPVDPGRNADLTLPVNSLGLTNEVFINRNFTTGIAYQRRRDNFSLDIYRLEQSSTSGNQNQENAIGTSGSWGHQISREMSAGLNINYQNRQVDTSNTTTDFYYLSPYLSYQLGPHVNSTLSYSWMDASSDDETNTYTENAVLGSLTYAF